MQSVCEFSKSLLAVAGFFFPPVCFSKTKYWRGKREILLSVNLPKNQDFFSLFLIAFFVSVREEAQDPQLEKS